MLQGGLLPWRVDRRVFPCSPCEYILHSIFRLPGLGAFKTPSTNITSHGNRARACCFIVCMPDIRAAPAAAREELGPRVGVRKKWHCMLYQHTGCGNGLRQCMVDPGGTGIKGNWRVPEPAVHLPACFSRYSGIKEVPILCRHHPLATSDPSRNVSARK